MKKVIIIPNRKKDVDFGVTSALVKKLISLGMTPFADEKYCFSEEGVTLKNDAVGIKATAKIPYGDKIFSVNA